MDVPSAAVLLVSANRRWLTPSGARGQCATASRAVQKLVPDTRAVMAAGPLGTQHFAVLVDDVTVCDLTARQFDPTADVPLICSLHAWHLRCRRWWGPGTTVVLAANPL